MVILYIFIFSPHIPNYIWIWISILAIQALNWLILGIQEGNGELQEHYHNNKDLFQQQNQQSSQGTVDGFDISGIPDYEGEDDTMPNKDKFNASKLLQIGDITVPELRRRLFKKRQEILTKNKYYVQQKVYSLSHLSNS